MKLPRPPTIDDKALAAVDGEWRTVREIFITVDEGGPHATRAALARLADAGKIERRYDPHQAGKIARYRRLSDVTDRA